MDDGAGILANTDRRLRAFWHPMCHIADVGAEPRRVELLGEVYAVVSLGTTWPSCPTAARTGGRG